MKVKLIYVAAGLLGVALIALVASAVALLAVRAMLPSPVLAVGAPDRGGYVAGSGGLVQGKEVALPKFVTNLADPGAAVDVTFVLVVRTEKDAQRVQEVKNQLRDTILGVLRAKKAAELTGPNGKDSLARDIQARANELLGSGTVTRVLVADLVTQP